MNQRKLPKVLAPAEVEAFRSVVKRGRDRAGMSLMLDAGLRASEVVNLRLQDIDWNRQVLRFVGKGRKEAELPISNRLRDELEKAIKERSPKANHDYLLYNLRHPEQPISRFALLKLVRKYGRRAGIGRKVFCHLLRHTFGTAMYREVKDLGRVQKAMRHSSPTTTTIYMHLNAEDQRADFEAIDKRPLWRRWWSRLKPKGEFWQVRAHPFYIGQTIGREKEITQLRKNLANRMSTVLSGERGTGKSHLLRQLTGERIYRLEDMKPIRECVAGLCEQLHADGLLAEIPHSRGSSVFVRALQEAGKRERLTLVIDSITDSTKPEGALLQKLVESWVIFTAIDRRQKDKIRHIFFGKADIIEVECFDRATAFAFAETAMADLYVADTDAYLNHLYIHSQGNPQAILEMIETTRKKGDLSPSHVGTDRVLPAYPFLMAVLTMAFVVRSIFTTASEPMWKIYTGIFIGVLVMLITVDKILKDKAK